MFEWHATLIERVISILPQFFSYCTYLLNIEKREDKNYQWSSNQPVTDKENMTLQESVKHW